MRAPENAIVGYDPEVPAVDLLAHPANARRHPGAQRDALRESLGRVGWVRAVKVNTRTGLVLDGHARVEEAITIGATVPVLYLDVEPIEEHYVLAHFDALAALATPDEAATAALLELAAPESSGLAALLAARAGPLQLDPPPPDPDDPPPPDPAASGEPDEERPSLADRFGVPPFSVLDASQPYWRAAAAEFSDCPPVPGRLDPVLVDLLFRWFAAPELPVVAAGLGCETVQWTAGRYRTPCLLIPVGPSVSDPEALTPIESHGGIAVKRDDVFVAGGQWGGKARSCWTLITTTPGCAGVVTAGSRQSPQVAIVAGIAAELGLPCAVHVPAAQVPDSPELAAARAAGAEVVEHRPGYNSVIVSRATRMAEERGWLDVPFGMETPAAVTATARQAAGVPADTERVVIAAGSAMSLAGVLTGLPARIPVLAVRVGADPADRLARFAPDGWADRCTLVDSELDYHQAAPTLTVGSLALDPIYEAKTIPFLRAGDLLWVVGLRGSSRPVPDPSPIPPGSCGLGLAGPGLAALSEADLSDAVSALVQAVGPDRFVVAILEAPTPIVGTDRDPAARLLSAFAAAGAPLYNELVAASSTRPASWRFPTGRRLPAGHRTVLVFTTGPGRNAADGCAPIDQES